MSFQTSHQLPGGNMGTQALIGPNFALNPATGLPFVVEANSAGVAPSLKVLQVVSGRLADVYDLDPATGARTLRFVDLLIGADIDSDGVDFLLEQKPLTQRFELTVLHAWATPAFDNAFAALEAGLQTFSLKSFDPNELPPFTAMPRNSALAIRFDDLLRDGGNPGDPNYPGTITAQTVKLVVGAPPLAGFDARILPDPNHGDLENGKFHSTRVLVDVAISELEALASNLPINPVGLPGATSIAVANAGLRLPTAINTSVGQLQVVTNLSGAHLAFSGNGPTDPLSPTLDVVRAFRSGGDTSLTGDPQNGFLPDHVPPSLLVELTCNLTSVHATAVATDFRVAVRFPDKDCNPRMRPGDLIATASNVVELVQVGPTGAIARVVQGAPSSFAAGTAQFRTTWSQTIHLRPECVPHFVPTPGDPPVKLVSNQASVVLAFSEPMQAASVRPFDTFRLQYVTLTGPLSHYVVGSITPSAGLDRFTFTPALPLRHVSGQSEHFLLDLDGTASGVRDLAGNPLALDLPNADFFLDPTQPSIDTNGIALRFTSADEDFDGKPELRGQFLYDLAQQEIRPRPVVRFTAAADPSSPTVAAMIQFPGSVQQPLTPHGAKVQAVWRYHDLGFGLLDDQTHNLDVEGLSWSPSSGAPVADQFTRFQIALGHSKFLPDEELSTGLLPNWPSSGLVSLFAANGYDATDPPTIVHAASKGYTVDPSDVSTSPAGLSMTHWPLNRGIPTSQFTYWTWRDTSKLGVAAPGGTGADTGRLRQILQPAHVSFYPSGKVPTIGLPLLAEFRAYPDPLASGANGLRVAIAINSSANPYFRAYSAGYVNCSTGGINNVDPDTSTFATGGYDPVHCIVTPPRDNVFYYGQADFVVRVSRLHTVWFDTLATSSFVPPVIEAGSTGLPPGTQIQLAYRGATSFATAGVSPWHDAANLDAYGDGYAPFQLTSLGKPANQFFMPTYFPSAGDKSWQSSIAAINGARFVQVRVSFLSNAETNASASLTSLGIAFQH